MPLLVDPMPPSSRALRFGAPEEAHEASYFAASARISSLVCTGSICLPRISFRFCSFAAGESSHVLKVANSAKLLANLPFTRAQRSSPEPRILEPPVIHTIRRGQLRQWTQ